MDTACVSAASQWSSHGVETRMAWLASVLETENRQGDSDGMRATADKTEGYGQRGMRRETAGQGRHGAVGRDELSLEERRGRVSFTAVDKSTGIEGCKQGGTTDT